ncbi:MAG: hypothetical protein D6714_14320 [Bacteroidetes bacterium]|nr:MAG: hypothetical protein D6714_14320 [Bacteroidota bacterium]
MASGLLWLLFECNWRHYHNRPSPSRFG